MDIDNDFDPGLLPLDPEALDSAVRVLGVTQKMVVPPTSDDTIDRQLVRVGKTFHDFLTDILSPLATKSSDGPGPALQAGIHAWTIADLLMALTTQSPDDTHERGTKNGKIDHPRHLSEKWLKAIIDVSLGEEEPPWHTTEVYYATIATGILSASARVLLDEPWLSLDPDDPSIRVRPLPDPTSELNSQDVAVALVWHAASTLCIAAAVAPGFRFGKTDIR